MSDYPAKAEVLDSITREWLTEVARLRKEASQQVPGPDAQPADVYRALLAVRGSLDRVEEILATAQAMRAAAEMSAREKADTAADELDAAIVRHASKARDYEGARERASRAAVDTIRYAQEARAARRLADQVTSVESRIRLAHRGLDTTRSDLIAVLRHVSWESSLDR